MAKRRSAIERWKAGPLVITLPWPSGPGTGPALGSGPRDYRPIGGGLAIPTEPLTATLEDPPELRGLVLEFDMRRDRLTCISVSSPEDGPEITSSLLRRVAPLLRGITRELFERSVVRLVELPDGGVGGVPAWTRIITDKGEAVGVAFSREAVTAEYERRKAKTGRPPLSDAHLQRVAELYKEARRQRVPYTEFIGQHYPHTSAETIRNWKRKAKPFLEPKGEEQNDG